jgi:hypothetical protein
MDDRIPCAICGTAILPITVKSNAGLCGQCIRDPERARKRAARKKTLLGWGDPSREAIRSRLFEACHTAAVEAVRRFSSETIYGFFLYLDPCWESISGVRVFTEEWARTETSTGLWTPLYTEETAAYIVGVEATEAVSEFASRRSPASNLFQDCVYALGALRDSSVFTERVVLGASSGDESPEETLAFCELANRKHVTDWYASTVSCDQSELELRRRQFNEMVQGA